MEIKRDGIEGLRHQLQQNCRGRAKVSTGELHQQKGWKSELRKSALAHQSSWNSHGGPGKSESVPDALWRWDLGQNGGRCRRKLHRNSEQDTIHGGWTGRPELSPETNTSTESHEYPHLMKGKGHSD